MDDQKCQLKILNMWHVHHMEANDLIIILGTCILVHVYIHLNHTSLRDGFTINLLCLVLCRMGEANTSMLESTFVEDLVSVKSTTLI